DNAPRERVGEDQKRSAGERRRRDEDPLIVADQETKGVRNDETDEADRSGGGYRRGGGERRGRMQQERNARDADSQRGRGVNATRKHVHVAREGERNRQHDGERCERG